MFLLIYVVCILRYSIVVCQLSNTYVFSGGSNTYLAFDSWRPCLTGYIRFDFRTNLADGTIAYIDDRGKFDFFYLKLLQGKLRLLFNLGNDRQALNINRKLNDDQWHTVLIKRHGQMTSLIIDHGQIENSTVTYSEDLYFGGSMSNEYEASPFYFGGIPSILERPSSGNLSSFDVYMQPRFRGQIRNIIYKNCTDKYLIQPILRDLSGGISLISNSNCSKTICGQGHCLINDQTRYICLCDETDFQGPNCEYPREKSELTFIGKEYLKYHHKQIQSQNEILTFHFQTNHYDGLIFQLVDSQFYIKLKSGRLFIEYRINSSWYDLSTNRDLNLIDNQWHFVQIQRNHGQLAILIDEIYLQMENDIRFDQILDLNDIFIGGHSDDSIPKFYGCLKDISLIINENLTLYLNQSFETIQTNQTCQSLLNPIQFLLASSYITIDLGQNFSVDMNLSFRFETYSSECILFYIQSYNQEHFLGIDLFDGFIYLTINMNKKKQRKELFQQRFNDGQAHIFQLEIQSYSTDFQLHIKIDHRQNTKILIRNSPMKINLQMLTLAGVNPNIRWLPTNFYSGILHRGFIGCLSDFEINNQQISLTKSTHSSNLNQTSRIGPCSIQLSTKRQCSCEHNGECRLNQAGSWTCDCSKTGYTGQRCEQLAYHLDLNEIKLFELNTNIQWSEQINEISFNLQAIHDEEKFVQIRSCRYLSSCDSIDFSIRNGHLQVNFFAINFTIEYPFLLDNQWHSIKLHRINTSFLLHIDNHIIQQRVYIQSMNNTIYSTIWIIFHGHKQILIEDLRLYEQIIFSKLSKNQLKTRIWKPMNTISFDQDDNSFVDIQLNDILCQDCLLNAFTFQFRTNDLNGLLFFSKIQTKSNSSSEYFILKFINGYLHCLIINQWLDQTHQIQSQTPLNDNDWHHLSFYRTSDYHFQLTIDSNEYILFTPIYFLDKLTFGQSNSLVFLQSISTLKVCLASLTINSHSINIREYIKLNTRLRNDCFLESQCPLKYCLNTGYCLERMQCNCEHTSFQGRFCQQFKIGYRFNSSSPSLIFDQPFFKEKIFSIYRISFGIITKMNTSELIRINDQIHIELYYGSIRIFCLTNQWFTHSRLINDGFYHLIQIEYELIENYLNFSIDNQKQQYKIKNKISFDKPLLLLIGLNSFQGELYGLQSDIYSIFDLISPTFQRISYVYPKNRTLITSSIIYPLNEIENDTCTYQSFDEICMISFENQSNLLSYTNRTFQIHSLPQFTKKLPNSTVSYQEIYFHSINSTISSIVTQVSSTSSYFLSKYSWRSILILFLIIFLSLCCCLSLIICCCMKYRRKDAGVYELVETQRFRPLTITGEKINEKNKINLHKKRKRKKSPLIETTEQREFYI